MVYEKLRRALLENRPVADATLIGEGDGHFHHLLVYGDGATDGTLGDADLDRRVAQDALAALDLDESASNTYSTGVGEVSVFIRAHNPPPTLVCFGAVHVGEVLTKLAKLMGFRTVLVDPRELLATSQRFGHVDELIVGWPQDVADRLNLNRNSFVAVLTHDPKFDEPALVASLERGVRYVGVLGSRKTVSKRLEGLIEMGVPPEKVAEIRAPIGLNLGSDRAEVIALGILAEMISVKYRGTGRPMEEKRLAQAALGAEK